ncbi:MAG: LptF/LptG family permease [Verrucomicrobiota bacterium]
MKLLYKYLITQVSVTTFVSIAVLTFILVLGNAFQRVFDLLVNNDVPLTLILKMLFLLIPTALTFTIPWGLLIGILITFGRMCQDHEITAIRSAGIGLVPFSAPVILFSLLLTGISFYNNASLAPSAMTNFKLTLVELGRSNPTMFLKAQQPIREFGNMRIYLEHKEGNRVSGIHIWEVNDQGTPIRSVRADSGVISANLSDKSMTITLNKARQEERGPDPTVITRIESGMKASQLPIRISLENLLDTSRVEKNITVWTLSRIRSSLFDEDEGQEFQLLPILTELQKRLAFSCSCFTFALIGIPLAITTGRKETSVSFVVSLSVVIAYYLMVVLAMSLKEKAGAYPEVIVWAPNFIFQTLGFFLLWKVNKTPF